MRAGYTSSISNLVLFSSHDYDLAAFEGGIYGLVLGGVASCLAFGRGGKTRLSDVVLWMSCLPDHWASDFLDLP